MITLEKEVADFREAAFLSCLLHEQDGDVLRDALTLPIEAFSDPARRAMYSAMLAAHQAGEALDEMSVGPRLAELDKIYKGGGGIRAVAHLYNAVDTAAMLHQHLHILREWGKMRLMKEQQQVAGDLLAKGDLEGWRECFNKMATVADGGGAAQWFTIRGVQEILDYKIPPDHGLIRNENNEALFEFGSVAGIVGPPGVGKSRMALQLAISQITGRTWCDLKTIGPARRWLMIGNENSRRRIARDLQGMCKNLSDDKLQILKSNLFTQVPEKDGDLVIAIKADNMTRWRNTLQKIKPDVVVVDPFEACLENYDVNDAAEVRDTIQRMVRISHEANPLAIVIFVHHARTGQANASQATGFGKDNFAKGSKTFTSMIRLQINIAPGDPDDFGKLVVSVGKSNDAKPFFPQGVAMDEETRYYEKWDDFDYEEWRGKIMADGAKKSGRATEARKEKAQIVHQLVKAGHNSRSKLVAHMKESLGLVDMTARRYISYALKEQTIKECGLPGQFVAVSNTF